MSRTSKTARALMLSSLVQLMTSSVPEAADLLSSIRGAHEITIGTSNDAPFPLSTPRNNLRSESFPTFYAQYSRAWSSGWTPILIR
jgi:hypothetical protein